MCGWTKRVFFFRLKCNRAYSVFNITHTTKYQTRTEKKLLSKQKKGMAFWALLAAHRPQEEQLSTRLICREAAYYACADRRISEAYRGPGAMHTAMRACRWDIGQRTWAFDDPGGGRGCKRYVNATESAIHALLWVWLPPEERTCYEIIAAPSSVPQSLSVSVQTRLYLDCEYERDKLTAKQLAKMPSDADLTKSIVTSLSEFALKELPYARIGRKAVTLLTAHNDKKYSVHLVFRFFDKRGNEIMFEDLRHVGAFMRKWESTAAPKVLYLPTATDTNDTPNATSDKGDCIVDAAVYTSNRCFRTVMCTKLGGDRPLLLNGKADIESEMAWRASLVQVHTTHALRHAQPFSVMEIDGSEPRSSSKFHDQNKRSASSSSAGASALKMPRLASGQSTLTSAVVGWMRSFITSHADYGTSGLGGTDQVQPCDLRYKSYVLVINVRTHYCAIARREHKNNFVYFTVNAWTQRAYQKCHDAACEGQRAEIEVPEDIQQKMIRGIQFMALLEQAVSKRQRGLLDV